MRTGDAPTVFICHASADAEVAAAIVHLLRAALRLSSSRIRCTSVDGSRLPVGAFITPVVNIAGAVDAGANEAAGPADMATPMERELLLDFVMNERLSTLADLHISAERRLAKVLVHHAQKCGSIDGPYWHIKDRVSHEELALLAATTRPRVTAFMQRFRALGIIGQSPDALRVHREKALKLLLEG